MPPARKGGRGVYFQDVWLGLQETHKHSLILLFFFFLCPENISVPLPSAKVHLTVSQSMETGSSSLYPIIALDFWTQVLIIHIKLFLFYKTVPGFVFGGGGLREGPLTV